MDEGADTDTHGPLPRSAMVKLDVLWAAEWVAVTS